MKHERELIEAISSLQKTLENQEKTPMIKQILRAIAAALVKNLESTPSAGYVPVILSPLGGF